VNFVVKNESQQKKGFTRPQSLIRQSSIIALHKKPLTTHFEATVLCVLCETLVNFVVKNESQQKLRFHEAKKPNTGVVYYCLAQKTINNTF